MLDAFLYAWDHAAPFDVAVLLWFLILCLLIVGHGAYRFWCWWLQQPVTIEPKADDWARTAGSERW